MVCEFFFPTTSFTTALLVQKQNTKQHIFNSCPILSSILPHGEKQNKQKNLLKRQTKVQLKIKVSSC